MLLLSLVLVRHDHVCGSLISTYKFINHILQVTQDFRLSYGLGLALKLGGVARIELNYCVPVKV